jgi:2-methylisocitrate lyase-like PEP mutase family enzyme
MDATALRARLRQTDAVLCPGVYDPLSALLAEQAGFEALYLSGANVAYTSLAAPDIGLVSITELADVMARIRDRVSLPVVVDMDTGFGNALNTQRSVRMLERAGANVLQIEDQTFPKRCGHLRGKSLISKAEMVGKLHAALDARDQTLIMARTDAIAVDGFDAAMDRAEAYVAAGADLLFVEAPVDIAQMRAIADRFADRVPLLANMVEGGRTPIKSAAELADIGYRLVIFPGGTVRFLAHGLQRYFAALRANGNTTSQRHLMFDFDGLNSIIGTDGILAAAGTYDGDATHG